jgi:transcriptional regulator with XRE-family HTH domain
MHEDFEREFLAGLGFDRDDPQVVAAMEDAEAHMRLVETLVGIREGRKLKQKIVAERMGTTQSRVSNFERIGGDPRLSTILRYARAVDAKVRMSVSTAPRGWSASTANVTASVAIPQADVHFEGAWKPVSTPATRGCA